MSNSAHTNNLNNKERPKRVENWKEKPHLEFQASTLDTINQ